MEVTGLLEFAHRKRTKPPCCPFEYVRAGSSPVLEPIFFMVGDRADYAAGEAFA